MEFSPQQLENWKAFERVRKGGKYNELKAVVEG